LKRSKVSLRVEGEEEEDAYSRRVKGKESED
jgi:hypothetical protein